MLIDNASSGIQGDVRVLSIEKVDMRDLAHFRKMVETYWQELMPQAIVVRDPLAKEAYFQEQFTWDSGNNHPYWAIVGGSRVGFSVQTTKGSQNKKFREEMHEVVLPSVQTTYPGVVEKYM